MYTEYWNLKCLPFENAPDPKFFYTSRGHNEAITRLLFCLQTKKAFMLLTGDYGSGKTVVCETVINTVSSNELRTAFITNPRMDAVEMTREIAYQLGEEIKSTSRYDVTHGINNILDRHAAANRHCAAIVDEAQLIMDKSILEDLRLLLNHQKAGQFLLTLVLVGQTELNDMIRLYPQLMQRIGLKFHIPHLQLDEVANYMKHRLETAGAHLTLFDEQAIEEVKKLSKGNPREINALCDMALLTASLSGAKQVTAAHVIDAGQERML